MRFARISSVLGIVAALATSSALSREAVELHRPSDAQVWSPVPYRIDDHRLGLPVESAPIRLATHLPTGRTPGAVSGLKWNSGMACHSTNFESFRGRKADVYVAFVGRSRRSSVISTMRSSDIGKFAKMPGQLSLSWPMLPEEIAFKFAECARGDFDQFARDGANALKTHGIRDPIVRLGWEVNGKYPWSLGPHPDRVDAYKACYKRQVKIFRSILPDVRIEWTNRRAGEIPYSIERVYPGDGHVDIIGMMYYDRWPPHFDQKAWDAAYNKRDKFGGPFGFGTYLSFAASRSKRLAVSEWAVSNNDNDPRSTDNSFYVQKMYDTFKANAHRLAYESYFHCGDADNGYRLTPSTINPKGAAKYRELWRKPLS